MTSVSRKATRVRPNGLRGDRRRRTPLSLIVGLVAVAGSFGCWEQIDGGDWFPQMKRQLTIQAFERVVYRDQLEGFTPPEGTVPVGGSSLPDVASLNLADLAAQDAIMNPVPPSFESLKKGEVLFGRYCTPCHGPLGMGDGLVAAASPFAPNNTGPFPAILPINGPISLARVRSDGHIYTTITRGRGRMPNYNRIPPMERWDLINYVREINGQGVRQ